MVLQDQEASYAYHIAGDMSAFILFKESLSVCNANKLPLFAGVFTTPCGLDWTNVYTRRTPATGMSCTNKCQLEKVMPGQECLKVPTNVVEVHRL